MKAFSTFLGVLVLLSNLALADDRFPVGPDPQRTPGSLCASSAKKRYKENINYCERNVNTSEKNQIIKMYDEELGFEIRQMNRQDFKIDHFIPLSIGGSNAKDNLWPQHKTVFEVTDPLEQELSNKIVAGLISQSEAVRIIREAKLNLGRVPELLDYVRGL
ncbi:MAG: hypothetical protein K0R29_2621 [Pseudobdellovibrio sp.]|jgi:hypothetical protein|nr:hypothetical protein [Pseudobdellovibrio sp.]